MVKKGDLLIKVIFSDPSDLILIIGFLESFKFVCGMNRLQERAAMWMLHHWKRIGIDPEPFCDSSY